MKLTDHGLKEITNYIAELKAKQKEILDAGLDTADDTDIPTVEDIMSDIPDMIDEDGDYYNSWGVTDNYDADNPILLQQDKDFIMSEVE